MKRGCCISVIVLFLICVIGVILLWFVGRPWLQDQAQEGIRDAISTAVAEQIPAPPSGTIEPGTYTLTEAALQQEINASLDAQNVDDLVIDITPTGLSIELVAEGDQDIRYSGTPTAVGGLLVMTNMEASDSFLEWFLPADDLGDAIEEAVNTYLANNNLTLADLDMTDTELVLVTESAT
jgi:hypothetical protein